MGAPNTVSFVQPSTDGAAEKGKNTLRIIAGLWAIVKVEDDRNYLVFSDKTNIEIHGPLIRYNKYSVKDKARPARCSSVSGAEFEMIGEPDPAPWFEAAWKEYWTTTVRDFSKYAFVEMSFYDEELGKLCRARRKHIPPTPALDTSKFPSFKSFHLAHLRIQAGIRGYPNITDEGDHGKNIDDMLGLKYTASSPYVTGQSLHTFPRGGVTLAYAMIDAKVTDPDGDTVCLVMYAMAVCSIEDRYDRKRGAQIALSKLSPVFEEWRCNPGEIYPGVSSVVPSDCFEKGGAVSVDPVYRQGSKVHFNGVGVFVAAFKREFLEIREGICSIKSPFFPTGHLTHIGILAHAIEALEFASKSRGMNRISDVLHATMFGLEVELKESNVSLPTFLDVATTTASADKFPLVEDEVPASEYHGA